MNTGKNTEKNIGENLFGGFSNCTVKELEELLKNAKSREEKAFYRTLVNLKLQIDQEKIIGKPLV